MEDQIRELAYQKWEAAGAPQGDDGVQYWLQAEEELSASPPKSCDKEPRKIAAKATAKRK